MTRIRFVFVLLAVSFAASPVLALEPVEIDPCVLNPASCIEILPIDPCVLFPESCEGPPSIDPDYAFGGMQKVKIGRFGKQQSVAMHAFEVGGLGAFAGTDEEDRYYTGTWIPVGKSGRKFALTLDTASQTVLAAKIASAASSMTGVPQAVVFTKSPKIVVKLDEAGEGTFKIKFKGVLDGTNVPVRYKAKLVGGSGGSSPLPRDATRTSAQRSNCFEVEALALETFAQLRDELAVLSDGGFEEINWVYDSLDDNDEVTATEQTQTLDAGALNEIIREMERIQECVRNNRQRATTAFSNSDQKDNQLFNMLTTVLKNMKEMNVGVIRNTL